MFPSYAFELRGVTGRIASESRTIEASEDRKAVPAFSNVASSAIIFRKPGR